jgi:hypothetical protein
MSLLDGRPPWRILRSDDLGMKRGLLDSLVSALPLPPPGEKKLDRIAHIIDIDPAGIARGNNTRLLHGSQTLTMMRHGIVFQNGIHIDIFFLRTRRRIVIFPCRDCIFSQNAPCLLEFCSSRSLHNRQLILSARVLAFRRRI